ncbi:MAG: 4-hydroxy-tetrahydrodipicolinate reductase [Eubacteriales bacterium]
MIRVILNGVNGKMGQVLANTISVNENIAVIAGIDRFTSAHKNPFPVYENINECDLPADVLIDFSRPEALPNNIEYCKRKNMSIVIATTGFNADELAIIEEASNIIPIFMASNMSLGVNLQMELCKKAASFLGYSYDVEIIETHHNQKVDSPSGTALSIANSINEAYLNTMDYTYGRHSRNDKRTNHEIGIHSVRGGTVPGEHQVKFFGNDEILEINHFAISKQIFAVGAIRAAKFISEKAPGLYGMKDILAEQSELTNVFCDVDQAIVFYNRYAI